MTIRIIWGGLLGAQIVYATALRFVLSTSGPLEGFVNEFILPLFSTVGLINCFIAVYFPRYLLSIEKAKLLKIPGSGAKNIDINELVNFYRTPFIIRMALFESVTLLGFGVSFVNKNFELMIPFISVSVAAFILIFPTEEKIRNAFS